MNTRNLLYFGIGALAIVTVVLGYTVYQDRQNAGGVEIKLGEDGLSVEQN